MKHVSILRDYGLFDAKVPRYTSYPPANRFELGIGARLQSEWLAALSPNEPISVYVHIPFCRRLCWFCACRTQGTKTLAPVDAYIDDLVREISLVSEQLASPPPMARLHLGGGTPTLLTVKQMERLLDAIEAHFKPTPDWEFSVEIDPTEAAFEILDLLAARWMRRASIGVQGFAEDVQNAIGRRQSFEQTRRVVDRLRQGGVDSLNIDLLYGLPFQTLASLQATLLQVETLKPDRLALYGYAHVPHMSKRQVMIPSDLLPSTEERFACAEKAKETLQNMGYEPIGIDHFARASDGLAKAAQTQTLRRNFQGYTDDPCETLIGLGASAISRFQGGYVQNAVATIAYQQRIHEGILAGCKGYQMTDEDLFVADVIDQIMCCGHIDSASLINSHPEFSQEIAHIQSDLLTTFPEAFSYSLGRLQFRSGMEALTRVVAARVDAALRSDHVHSVAI